jgi:hypothetical protein
MAIVVNNVWLNKRFPADNRISCDFLKSQISDDQVFSSFLALKADGMPSLRRAKLAKKLKKDK